MEGKKIIDYMDFFEILKNKASKQLLQSTCQIIERTEDNNGRALGTGILLKINELHFLLSAAHVNYKNYQDICIPHYNGQIINLQGDLTIINSPGFNTVDDDKFDLILLKIKSEIIPQLTNYKFLDLNDLEPNHILLEKEQRYLFAGFPYSKTKQIYKKPILRAKPVVINTTVIKDNNIYKKIGFNNSTHILIDYNVKLVKDNSGNKPKIAPHGMSGGGLWYLSKLIEDPKKEKISVKLLGVLIEYHITQKVIVATRIDFILYLLNKKYNIDIPRLNINYKGFS